MPDDKNVLGIDLNKITNRNERRVAERMPELLKQEYGEYYFDALDIEDIYALTLNLLRPQYAQKGSIIISDRIRDEDILDCLRQAVERVLDHPTGAKV